MIQVEMEKNRKVWNLKSNVESYSNTSDKTCISLNHFSLTFKRSSNKVLDLGSGYRFLSFVINIFPTEI